MVMTTLDFMGVVDKEDGKDAAEDINNCDQRKLEELSEEEILQLTREDCRRYLKDKVSSGMRRPSWNKAQAVQQVLSLKSLCEQQPKGEDDGMKEPPKNSPRQQPLKRTLSSTFNETPLAKKPCNATSQLTMFYAGMVAVYEDIPADKAQAIMLLASDMMNGNTNAAARLFMPGKAAVFPGARTILELPQARKASLQRFLQKRRERMTNAPTEHSEKKIDSGVDPISSNINNVNNATTNPSFNKQCENDGAAAAATPHTSSEIEVSSH